MSRGGFWSIAIAKENLLCCPPLGEITMEEIENLFHQLLHFNFKNT
jgi:hypothetical protein